MTKQTDRTKAAFPCADVELYTRLQTEQKQLANNSIIYLFQSNPERFTQLHCQAAGLVMDYSKNLITNQTLSLLFQLAENHNLQGAITAMLHGEPINHTEQRAALHTALRNQQAPDSNRQRQINQCLEKITAFVEAIQSQQRTGYSGKAFTDIVNIGIGGSDLGPHMVIDALQPFHTGHVKCHFVSNVDASDIIETLKPLNPETTLFIIASKTFTTLETLINAKTAQQWLTQNVDAKQAIIQQHFIAVSANPQNAMDFGIHADDIFPIWDWVGGRYSLWSAIGLSIALAVGIKQFNDLRDGAHTMDRHFATAPMDQNMPVIMGLLGIWYNQFWQASSHVVLPYDYYLRRLPSYLQQLDMESNGKQVNHTGHTVGYQTGSILWGEPGTNAQHSFHQLLHQGTHFIPADFIVPLLNANAVGEHPHYLFANCLSQSRALMVGKTLEQAKQELLEQGMSIEQANTLAPHKVMPGSRPSNTIITERLTPQTLGALLALYEHKIFVQSVIWQINPFDQWGVELGKQLSSTIYKEMTTESRQHYFDTSTEALMAYYKKARQ